MPEIATPASTKAYDRLRALQREAGTLASVSRLLGWDQETYMPNGGAAARAEQQSLLAGLSHDRATDPRLGELIAECEADANLNAPGTSTAANLREMRRDYDKAIRLPRALVQELARAGSESQQVWKKARAESDFKQFEGSLTRMVGLARQKAECLGFSEGGELYDALLDKYEPGMTAHEVEAVFTPLEKRLSVLVSELLDSGRGPDDALTRAEVPADRQHAFGLMVIERCGFDLERGRLDTTTHPFCEGLAPGDTRLTTRYREERWTDAFFGTMHEMGHGLYEQGLPKLAGQYEDVPASHFGEPLGESISLGIHESQSRMWENFVGRSASFWQWLAPHAHAMLGSGLERHDADAICRAVNTVSRSYIRVEADEATYNLHVMLRFGIERALIRGDLSVRDLPGAWNERFEKMLGVPVPDDRRGCLQDVHWSFGLMGYFPTYTLGNLYCAQLWEMMNKAIPDIETQMARGEFGEILTWLRTNVHKHGKRYRAGELCERVTGEPLSAEPLLRHLEGKLKPMYGLA
ncbi:MAG: carboxypeptidase M32 [Phycisphaerales bacterium]|nr:MAG: carboxypeptidase M32 [Phycisphaerales bacterium]